MNFKLIAKIAVLIFFTTSCKKFLDEKPNQKLATPDTLDDLQALIDNVSTNNTGSILINTMSDEYFLKREDWLAIEKVNQDGYTWEPQLEALTDWNVHYRCIFYANTVLDNLKRISSLGQENKWNYIKGEALFFRAHSLYQLSQLFINQYESSSATRDLGLPIRLNSNFNIPSTRSSVEQTYAQIINDLNESIRLIPAEILPNVPENKTRPTQAAAFALLARIYLVMGNYDLSKNNAAACLQAYSTLLDYGNTSQVLPGNNPFTRFNTEVILYTNIGNTVLAYDPMPKVDSNLYRLYGANDWRQTVLFRVNSDKTISFKGSYNGATSRIFNGIATDEVFLTLAESKARLGDTRGALDDLNTLLRKRMKSPFTDINVNTSEEALKIILDERKKELLFRGLRWTDIRRLNNDERYKTILKRNLNSIEYTLQPKDLRYTLLIPNNVILATNMQQNPR